MILIKCCATCNQYDDGTCTVDCHSTTADDWCLGWEDKETKTKIIEQDVDKRGEKQ